MLTILGVFDFKSDELFLPLDTDEHNQTEKEKYTVETQPVSQAFMYSRSPRHSFFEYVIRLQIQHAQTRFYGPNHLAPTGPVCYGWALEQYMGNVSADPQKKSGISPRDVVYADAVLEIFLMQFN